jgi:hypothetical protein
MSTAIGQECSDGTVTSPVRISTFHRCCSASHVLASACCTSIRCYYKEREESWRRKGLDTPE